MNSRNVAELTSLTDPLLTNIIQQLPDTEISAAQFALARCGNRHFSSTLFKPAASCYVKRFLLATLLGDNDSALAMLQRHPSLILERGHPEQGKIRDYSGRVYSGLTGFQLALCAGSVVTAKQMKDIYLLANPDGQASLNDQLAELFPQGYAAHIERQKFKSYFFEMAYIDPLVAALNNASINDLRNTLNMSDNKSKLYQTLLAFKRAFHDLSLKEKVYNPYHFLKISKRYNNEFPDWHIKLADFHTDEDDEVHWLHIDIFWRHAVGWMQRYMTANYAKTICAGLGNTLRNRQPLIQTMRLHHPATHQEINFFPLDTASPHKLGLDWGVAIYHSLAIAVEEHRELLPYISALEKFISSKNRHIIGMMPNNPKHNHSHKCITM